MEAFCCEIADHPEEFELKAEKMCEVNKINKGNKGDSALFKNT